MKYKHNRSKLDYRLRHITAMVGTLSENETIKDLCLLSDDLLAKQEDKPKTWNGTNPKDVLRNGTLAQEDKKECKHERIVTSDSGWEMWFCPKCNTVIEFKPIIGNQKPSCQKCSTPSTLDSIEEIKELKDIPLQEVDILDGIKMMNTRQTHFKNKINSLIRNQTKIINYLKGKK